VYATAVSDDQHVLVHAFTSCAHLRNDNLYDYTTPGISVTGSHPPAPLSASQVRYDKICTVLTSVD